VIPILFLSKSQQKRIQFAMAYSQQPVAARSASIEAAAANSSEGEGAKENDVFMQYIVLRKDLWKDLKWPLGSVVAQACHAATSALWLSREDSTTKEYCSPTNIDNMHKVISS